MKRLLACLALAACASVPAPPPERVAGCWINRSNLDATTMRWLPDPQRPGALTGDKLQYRASGDPRRSRYSLAPSADGYALCEIAADNTATACWQVAQGEGGSLEGGRAFIDVYGERLRISIIGAGPDRTIFQGRRDGCD